MDKCRSRANVYQVNACSSEASGGDDRSGAFENLDEEVRKHEADHVSAVVTEAAKHDVWGDWETVATASESGAETTAQMAAYTVQAALLTATQATHDAYTGEKFEVWWWFPASGGTPAEWGLATICTKGIGEC